MLQCPKCQKQNSDLAKFCTSCGASLTNARLISTQPPTILAKPSSKPGKRKRILLTTSFFLLAGLIASYFLFFNKQSKKESPGDLNTDTRILRELVNNWNDALNNKNLSKLASLYDEKLAYYQVDMSRDNCLEKLSAFLSKNSAFYQQLQGDILTESLDNNNAKCSFVKKVTLNGKSTDYPSYLNFSKKSGEWKIIAESDLITDKNIARQKEEKENRNNGSSSYTNYEGRLVFKSDCFVIITGSFVSEAYAKDFTSEMKKNGYQNTGYLWIPDYPSLSEKEFFATFIGPYQTYSECESDLRSLKQTGRFWYGVKVSYDNTRVDIR